MSIQDEEVESRLQKFLKSSFESIHPNFQVLRSYGQCNMFLINCLNNCLILRLSFELYKVGWIHSINAIFSIGVYPAAVSF